MIESKKIKKLEKVNRNSTLRFKKSQLKPFRAQVATISKPQINWNESNVQMMESDLIFALKDDQISFDISMLNVLKYITSVEIRKDLPEKIMTLHEVVSDLETNENPSIKELVESVKTFGNKYENFLKEFELHKKESSIQRKLFLFKVRQKAAERRICVLSTYPAFEMRYRLRKDEVKCTELCFNETFLREVGYTLENFSSTVLTEGLPQFFPKDSPVVKSTVKGFMEHYMMNETELPEQETEILMKSGYRKNITFQTLILVELSESDLILSLIFFMKTKSLPYGTYQKQPYSAEFLEILKKNDKEKEYLFNTYYGEKFQGLHSNTERVCKIKEIPAFQ